MGGETEEDIMAPALALAPSLFELMAPVLASNFFRLQLIYIAFKNFN